MDKSKILPSKLRKIVDDSIEGELKGLVGEVGASESSIMSIGELIESMYKIGNFEAGENLRPILDILVPKLLCELGSKENRPDEIPFERVFKFSNSYHSLRDYIFISFSNESSIGFSGDENSINVTVGRCQASCRLFKKKLVPNSTQNFLMPSDEQMWAHSRA